MERAFRELALGVSIFYTTLIEQKMDPSFAEELTRVFLQEMAELFRNVTMRAIEERKE